MLFPVRLIVTLRTVSLISVLVGALTAPIQAQQPLHPSAPAAPTRSIADALIEGLEWRSIGPANMGGRVTDVEGIPSPSQTFFVASATGGIWKTTNNGITFRPLFQHERVVSMGDIAIAPSDTLQIWAGTGEANARNSVSPGGGIYKSLDGGLSWRLMGLEKTEHIGRIVVHPTNANIVWVAAVGATWRSNPERGLYKTIDGGLTWRLVKFVSDRAGFVDVIVHPRNPNILFATSWERLRGPYFLQSGGPGSALWKSIDGGETWMEVKEGGFPATMKGRIGIDISRSDPNIMYALVEAAAPDGKPGGCEASKPGGCGLYRSEDSGATWTWVQSDNNRPFYYSQVRVDPKDPNRVYWSSTPVNLSTDGGKTARIAVQGLHVDHHAMWIDPNEPNRMIVGGDGGIGISFDRGGNYWFPNTFPIGQFYAVSYDMAVPYSVCGGLQDNGSWCGPSRSARWGGIDNQSWFRIGSGDGFVTAQDPRDPAVIYSEVQGAVLLSRRDLAKSGAAQVTYLHGPDFTERYRMWKDSIALAQPDSTGQAGPSLQARLDAFRRNQMRDSVADSYRYNWNTPFLLSPHNPDVLYVGANRVLKSAARGDSLRPISPDLANADTVKIRLASFANRQRGGITPDVGRAETYGTIVTLTESPLQRGLLIAGTDDGNVWLSDNDGRTWTSLTPRFRRLVPDTSYVSRIEASPHDANRFYVTFDNHRRGDFTPYVFVTRDGGRTFRSIASNLPTDARDFVHVVREDLVNPNLLFLGTDVGLFVSLNQGGNWRRIGADFPTVPVHDLKIHPRDRELIVATHGRSLWITDIAPLQQLTPQLLTSSAPVLFEPAPGLQFSSPLRGGEDPGHAYFAGDNKKYGAELVLYNPLAADRPPRVVITGARGDTVQTLSPSCAAGLQRVSWDFRYALARESRVLSPSERRDSMITMRRADVVADSLIRAGMDSVVVRRIAAQLKGERPPADPAAANTCTGGGSGGSGSSGASGGSVGSGVATGQKRSWVERPGEGAPESAKAATRDVTPEVWNAFRAAGVPSVPSAVIQKDRGLAEAGTYGVSLQLSDRTFSTTLQVIKSQK